MKLLLPHFPILIKTYVEFWIHVIQMDPVPAGNLVTTELGGGDTTVLRLGIEHQSSIVPESCLLLPDWRKFRNTLVLCVR